MDDAVTKENAVKRIATAAREGFAEWIALVSKRYYRDGTIVPITEEVERLYSSGEFEVRRQRIRESSATNPYRRGLELVEKIETDLGFQATLGGMITEWPLEQLRLRVPGSTVEGIRRGSPWAPDTRLERLAELSYDEYAASPSPAT